MKTNFDLKNKKYSSSKKIKYQKMVEKKTCQEFQETGLLLFVNTMLHIFGWAIVVKHEEDGSQTMFPARVPYKGFPEESVDKAYERISKYIKG